MKKLRLGPQKRATDFGLTNFKNKKYSGAYDHVIFFNEP